MTFSGEYRGHAHPHESPRSMTGVLVVLAVLSVVGGFVGLPHLWHLPNLFEAWMEPVFRTSGDLVIPAGYGHGYTWALMGISTAVALAGFLLARTLYRDAASSIPARLAESPNPLLRGIHRLVFEKYYVDEIYHAVWVCGCLVLSSFLSWFDRNVVDGIVNFCGVIVRGISWVHGVFDTYVVDGLVNAVAIVLRRCGASLRLLQAGRVQGYIVAAMVGAIALVLLGYFMW
jgi:NADH-quinone oxidoreductase subunit L